MKVLDDEDRAAAAGMRSEEPRPGKRDRHRHDARLRALEWISGDDDAGGGGEGVNRFLGFRGGEPERDERPGEPVAKALLSVLRAVIEPDAAGAPEDLAERPVARPSTGREATALEDRRGRGALARDGQELTNQATLADPRRAVDQHIPGLVFANARVQRAEQRIQLGFAPHEWRFERGVAHRRFACQRPRGGAHGELSLSGACWPAIFIGPTDRRRVWRPPRRHRDAVPLRCSYARDSRSLRARRLVVPPPASDSNGRGGQIRAEGVSM